LRNKTTHRIKTNTKSNANQPTRHQTSAAIIN